MAVFLNISKSAKTTVFCSCLLLMGIAVVGAFEPIDGVYRDYVKVLALLGKSDWEPRQMNTYSNSRSLLDSITTENHLWNSRMAGASSPMRRLVDAGRQVCTKTSVISSSALYRLAPSGGA